MALGFQTLTSTTRQAPRDRSKCSEPALLIPRFSASNSLVNEMGSGVRAPITDGGGKAGPTTGKPPPVGCQDPIAAKEVLAAIQQDDKPARQVCGGHVLPPRPTLLAVGQAFAINL